MGNNTNVVTRFAPSPTGYLHLGNARTALFNFVYAKKHGGKFIVRIEDTDASRSRTEYTDYILSMLEWMRIDYDALIFQKDQQEKHRQIAKQLLENGQAYYCYTTKEELEHWKQHNKFKKFISPWRNNHNNVMSSPPHDNPVLRLKIPEDKLIIVDDLIQGNVKVNTNEIEDIVLLRSDQTPTYTLAVVVDDHDTSITHIVRGSDHLTNTPKQILIYQAMKWPIPSFAHMPLIHDADGQKMSKRSNASPTGRYREIGILPEALFNYLIRLGWSLGDQEIISRDEAILHFDLKDVGRSPAKFDIDKLYSLNHHYIMSSPVDQLVDYVIDKHNQSCKTEDQDTIRQALTKGMPELSKRCNNLIDLYQISKIYINYAHLTLSEDAQKIIDTEYNPDTLIQLIDLLANISDNEFNLDTIKSACSSFAKQHNIKMGTIAKHLRVSVTKTMNAPAILGIISILGKEETLYRIKQFLADNKNRGGTEKAVT